LLTLTVCVVLAGNFMGLRPKLQSGTCKILTPHWFITAQTDDRRHTDAKWYYKRHRGAVGWHNQTTFHVIFSKIVYWTRCITYLDVWCSTM